VRRGADAVRYGLQGLIIIIIRGHRHYPQCMRVYYPSGQHFDVTLRSVRPCLQHPLAQLPNGVQIPVPASDAVVSSALVVAEQPVVPAVDLAAVHAQMPALLAAHHALTSLDLAVLVSVIDLSVCQFSGR
jgi:hypothetical protein